MWIRTQAKRYLTLSRITIYSESAMVNALNILEGHHVDVVESSDQLTLRADHGWVLAIYNRFTLSSVDKNRITADAISGDVIASTEANKEAVVIAFDSGATLSVDLPDDAYRGPEAMQLTGPNSKIIVWN